MARGIVKTHLHSTKYQYMKRIFLYTILLLLPAAIVAQQYNRPVRPTKNVILMVPDGTSTSVLSIARWYQYYNGGSESLRLDPFLCGLVKTYSSNSPTPDSAPAMSGYTTGMPSRAGNIAIYPVADPEEDIIAVDKEKAYQPLVTVLEAAKIQKGKATGIVVTTDFCHATPAACASHHYNRGAYQYLAPQMAANDLDVVFGGGYDVVTDGMKDYFRQSNTAYLQSDLQAFRDFREDAKIWALFAPRNIAYDIDRDEQTPSLAEMTQKAIELLDKKPNGFFLMVEGSRVDMAAHAKDPIGITTEFLAFDKAVGVAMDYAQRNGETAVIVLPDHGNCGFTLSNRNFRHYTEKGLDHSFGNLSQYKKTASHLEHILLQTKPEDIKAVFKEYTGIELTDKEKALLLSSKNYKITDDYTQVGNTANMISGIANIMTEHTHFSFVSGSHTAEDVFLAAYHPQGDLPLGLNKNSDINRYLCDVLGLETTLEEQTKKVFARHTDVFKGLDCSIAEGDIPTLTVKKGKNKLVVPAFGSQAYLNGKEIKLGSVVVYIDKNQTFYLPAELAGRL